MTGVTEKFLTGMVFDPAASIVQERDAPRNFIGILAQDQHALQQADVSLLLPLTKEQPSTAQQRPRLAEAQHEVTRQLGHSRTGC